MNIGIIGLGLIGGSFAKAAAQAGHAVQVWNRTRATAETAVSEGVAQAVLEDDIGACDGVIVALPYLIPWAVVAVVVIVIILRIKHKKENKNAAQQPGEEKQ